MTKPPYELLADALKEKGRDERRRKRAEERRKLREYPKLKRRVAKLEKEIVRLQETKRASVKKIDHAAGFQRALAQYSASDHLRDDLFRASPAVQLSETMRRLANFGKETQALRDRLSHGQRFFAEIKQKSTPN